MVCSTIREILVNTEKDYGGEDAVRDKKGCNRIQNLYPAEK